MKRWIVPFWHVLIQLGLVVLIVLALYSGLGRQVVRFYVLHPDQLNQVFKQFTGLNVHVQQMSARWHGLSPDLRFEHILWQAVPGQPAVHIDSVEIAPDLWGILRSSQPRLHLRLQGMTLHLRQGTDHHWYLDELAGKSLDPDQRARFIRLVVRQPALDLLDINLDVTTPQIHGIISKINLHYRNDFRFSALQAEAALPAFLAHLSDNRVRLSVLGDSEPGRHWRAFIHLPMLQADVLLRAWGPEALQAAQARMDVWLSGDRLDIQQLRLVMNDAHADLRRQGKLLHVDVPRLNLGAMHVGHDVNVWTDRLNLSVNHQHLNTDALEWSHHGSTEEIALEHTAIGTWMDLCRADQACAEFIPRAVFDEHIQGNLDRLAVRWQLPSSTQANTQILAIAGAVHDLDVNPQGAWPGVRHVQAEWHGTEHHIWVDLAGKEAVYEDPIRFSQPVPLEYYQLHLQAAQSKDGGWSLDAPYLALSNKDIHLKAAFSIRKASSLPVPVLSLKAHIEQGEVGQAWRYLPKNLLGQESVNWVHQALVSGRIQSAQALYEGRLQDDESPSLNMQFSLNNTELRYAPGWPALHALSARLWFEHGLLSIDAGQAQWQQTHIQDVTAQLDTHGAGAEVQVQGHLSGPADDVVQFLRSSPLHQSLDQALSGWNVIAPAESVLKLTVPLDSRPVKVVADAQLLPGTLRLNNPRVLIENVQGQIHYDTAKALSGQINGNLWGEPMTASMTSSVDQGAIKDFALGVRGHVSIQNLSRIYASPFWSSLRGATSWVLQVHWRPGQTTDLYSLRSDLQGLEIHAPDPLAKNAAEPWPLAIIASVGPQDTRVHIRLADRFGAALVFSQGGIQSGRISLGPNAVLGWPVHPGLSLQGSLDALDLDKWAAFLKPVRSSVPDTCCRVQRFDLLVHTLDVLGYRLAAAHLQGSTSSAHGWSVHLRSQRMNADLDVPDVPTPQVPVDLHIHQVFWPIPSTPGTAPLNPVSLQEEPPLNLEVDALHVPSEPDMQVRLSLLLGKGAVDIPQFFWQVPGVTANGRLHWEVGQATHLVADLDSHDISKVFELFDAVPTLDAEESRMHVDLQWPGSPSQAGLGRSVGSCSLHINNGRILQVSKAASASRVFGLFNFADLGRRLRLDFSDLVHKGVSFDHLDAENQLGSGLIHVQSFLLKGPALTVHGSGQLRLASEQMDMMMQVTVPVTRVVPVAVAVLAGPVVGGAALAAQALFGKPLDKLTTVRYHLTGDWNAPVVKLVGAGLHTPIRLPIELPFGHKEPELDILR